ncbi:MAG TPA: S8 family serine peptidase, partial [Flavobacterium sp.]|uniref:S8 family serine peptidase n=1 Tax=Flavobacterium sp. TaxID=239 RepID=UPI002C30F6B4
MYRRIIKLFLLSLIVFTSCSKEDSMDKKPIVISESQKNPLTPTQINAKIDAAINSQRTFNWRDADSHLLWSAVLNGNKAVSIGFGNSKDDFQRAKSFNNAQIQKELLDIILKYEETTLDKALIYADKDLNLIDVIITKQETIIALRESKYIRYIEPADYRYLDVRNGQMRPSDNQMNSSVGTSSGCGFDAEVLAAADYTTTTPNAKIPWTFTQHNIPNAWTLSTGKGVTIGIVDTGVSPNQSLLGANFNNGLSSGRTIQKNGVYVDSIWPWSTTTDGVNDLCGHGTSMA